MSIRCNELQVPAIGVGGHIYEKISKSDFIELDCNIKNFLLENDYRNSAKIEK